MGSKDVRGSTFFENNGYTEIKYNFSDLQFNPQELKDEEALLDNKIKFDIFGKHNIAASGDR